MWSLFLVYSEEEGSPASQPESLAGFFTCLASIFSVWCMLMFCCNFALIKRFSTTTKSFVIVLLSIGKERKDGYDPLKTFLSLPGFKFMLHANSSSFPPFLPLPHEKGEVW